MSPIRPEMKARTRIVVSDRLPGFLDANTKGKVLDFYTAPRGEEVRAVA